MFRFGFSMGPSMMDFGFESLRQQFLNIVLNVGFVPLVQELSPTLWCVVYYMNKLPVSKG